MQFNTIGFIGCGNMGGALAQALPKAGHDIFLANRTQSKADALAAKIGATVTDNQTIAKTCDLIFLGVKPQMMPGVLAELADTFARRPTPFVLVTMAAGLSMATIQQLAGGALSRHPHHAQHAGISGCGHDPVLRRWRGTRRLGRLLHPHGRRWPAGRPAGVPH